MTRIVLLKRVVFVAASLPLARLIVAAFQNALTANPIEYLTHQTGWWGLALLTTSLAVTPIRRISGWNPIIQLRRELGLFAFFYATLHLSVWVILDNFFDVAMMTEDVFERPFVTMGMVTFLMLLALALTSTQASIRRLGKRWLQLHRLVYVAAITAVAHFWWLVKADTREPLRWAIALAVLFGVRLWWKYWTQLSWRS